jgi:hypothetical protein
MIYISICDNCPKKEEKQRRFPQRCFFVLAWPPGVFKEENNIAVFTF